VFTDKDPKDSDLKLKLTNYLKQVLELLGEDPSREGLAGTPRRWAEALMEYTAGLQQDPEEHLKVIFQLDEDDFPAESDDMIIVDNIEFVSMCEHHIAPIRGIVHVAYIPNYNGGVVTGLSKLSRVVEVFARRLQMQERMTQQIAQAIDKHLKPMGVFVIVHAVHYCMIQRGVRQTGSSTLTTARRGVFLKNPSLEEKLQRYLNMRIDSAKNL